eukprot:352972-Chlamydomonas_euryale.AAC.2
MQDALHNDSSHSSSSLPRSYPISRCGKDATSRRRACSSFFDVAERAMAYPCGGLAALPLGLPLSLLPSTWTQLRKWLYAGAVLSRSRSVKHHRFSRASSIVGSDRSLQPCGWLEAAVPPAPPSSVAAATCASAPKVARARVEAANCRSAAAVLSIASVSVSS